MIIESLLDQDFYKFTMMQAILHNYPAAMVKYKFACRKGRAAPVKSVKIIDLWWSEVRDEIKKLGTLAFTQDDLEYLSTIPYFTPDFIQYLKLFRFDMDHVKLGINEQFEISVDIEGPWLSTILFEVPILAIISQLHHKYQNQDEMAEIMDEGRERVQENIKMIQEYQSNNKCKLLISDFGTRRRFSKDWQDHCIQQFGSLLVGTSNVMFAKRRNMKMIGTMAHEWIMAHQAFNNIRLSESQKMAFEVWIKEYRAQLGIALTDTISFDAFLNDFDLFFGKLYDGCRHDSGNPQPWCAKLISHYQKMGIDPLTKTAVFSDGLTFEEIITLHQRFNEKIKVAFGIGTNFTNNLGVEPLPIVIKMIECNGNPVAKISDSPGKTMCTNSSFLAYLKQVFGIKEVSNVRRPKI